MSVAGFATMRPHAASSASLETRPRCNLGSCNRSVTLVVTVSPFRKEYTTTPLTKPTGHGGRTSRPRVPAATSRGLLARCLPRRRPSARLASSHATAIRSTATAESCPKRAFSQPFPRSRASQNNSHSHHAIRQDASRQEVSRLSPLCTLSHCVASLQHLTPAATA